MCSLILTTGVLAYCRFADSRQRKVVMETGIATHFSITSQTELIGKMTENADNKIPEYAREYKREYQFIRGINKEFKYFMKRFLRGQEKGKLKDISEFEIEYDIVFNLIKIKNKLINIDQYLDFILNCYHEEDLIFINPYSGFIDFYYYFNLFFTKLNIKYEYEYDSDSDSDDF